MRVALPAGAGNREAAVPDALHADQGVGDPSHFRGSSPDDHDLEAILEIEMHVEGRQDRVMEGVLEGCELLAEQPNMVCVDERDGPHDVGAGRRR